MFDGHYNDWNTRRFNVIMKHFDNSFFKDKSLIEVGCGHAFFSKEFKNMGSLVTASDARKQYLDKLDDINTIVHDLDNDWNLGKFDIIIHFGVLYHLKNPKLALQDAIKNCNTLILETEVLNSKLDKVLFRREDGYDQAVNNIGNQLSVGAIETIIKESGKEFLRIDDPDLNSGFHHYDWPVSDDEEDVWKSGRRKFWIIGDK